ncbi:MAG: uracil-DNA glycosylase family protein, partial [Candidatus Limnocylindria bacterium]
VQGRPFVGAAGQLLDQLLAGIGLDRGKVFITNVVRHRPPENRDPLPEEVAACHVWFERHLAVLRPRVVVTLGRHAMYKFFPGESISRVHGRARKKDGITIFPVFHPAAALHQPSLRADLEKDFQALAAFLDSAPQPAAAAATAAEPAPKPAEQMTLLG